MNFARPEVTEGGRRNWERLVALASSDVTDSVARKKMADSLAALVSEVTPMHREVLASQFAQQGAPGRIKTWRIPPGLAQDPRASARWAAIVLLDCVDYVADMLAGQHPLVERMAWRDRAKKYTGGAENFPAA